MEEITFKSEDELYNRLLPAMKSKRNILNRSGYSYIKEEDIWETLKNKKWHDVKDLMLCDMVDDILHTDNKIFGNFYREKNNILIQMSLPRLKDQI